MDLLNLERRSGADGIIKLCEIIRSMNQDTQSSGPLYEKVREVYGQWEAANFWPSDHQHPCGGVFKYGDMGLLVSHGTDDIRQAPGQTAQYIPDAATLLGFTPRDTEQPACFMNELSGEFIKTQMGILSHTSLRALTVIGHSYGHACSCQAVLSFYRGTGEVIPDLRVYSIGGNAWANQDKKTWMDTHGSHVRICNHEDPVPCAPWIFADSATLLLGPGERIIRRLGNYHHWGLAYCLYPNGTATFQNLPDLADRIGIIRYAAMGDWFYSFVGDTITPHNVSQYIARLTAYRDRLTEAPIAPPAEVTQTIPYPAFQYSGRESEFVRDSGRAVLGELRSQPTGSMPVAQPVQGNMDSTRAAGTFFPTDIYVVRRIPDGGYGILQNGCLHSMYASKRLAKRECRALNRSRPRVRPN